MNIERYIAVISIEIAAFLVLILSGATIHYSKAIGNGLREIQTGPSDVVDKVRESAKGFLENYV